MDADSLKPWQARKIGDALYPLANYLIRLKTRMEKRGVLADHDQRYLASHTIGRYGISAPPVLFSTTFMNSRLATIRSLTFSAYVAARS